jgi:hypothetical protein
MLIESITPRRLTRLDGNAPAALDAFVDERRKRVLQPGFGQMIEENVRHQDS